MKRSTTSLATRASVLASLASILAVGQIASGCKNGDADVSCRTAASAYGALVNRELAKESDPERLKQARMYLPTLQNAILETCESSKWPESARRCMVEAKTVDDLVQCNPNLPEPPITGSQDASSPPSAGDN